MRKLRIMTLFSGIGFQEMGIPFPHDIVLYSEINEKLAHCFSRIHRVPLNRNLGDIRSVNFKTLPKDIDIMISTFPCQSFSIAGKKMGMDDPKNGDLLLYNLKMIRVVKPKVIIFENVKNITSVKFAGTVIEELKYTLNKMGYSTSDAILNAADYGVPQNRERWFMVCALNGANYQFPSPFNLRHCVADFIDRRDNHRNVDERMLDFFNTHYCDSRKYSDGRCVKLFDGYGEGYFDSGFSAHRIYSIYGCVPTMTTTNDCHFYEIGGKLNAKERFLLMGGKPEYFPTIQSLMSSREIHKLCGNGVVVNVMEHILLEVYNQFFSKQTKMKNIRKKSSRVH
jgi:DNA (cytosine-5)-methyltransferase 1